ncbi:hypothetical protein MZ909_07060 [Thermosynechococcus sp. B0]|uniref:hypothetical protein n=1 Tax=unclassified Thermosynechococcus TaxID=2622553 RepID=UPI002576EEB8|nr:MULTISPECIES: hypothetical protein [unclassified Thermosynechococcus]WJI22989.1 hypothetical protein MZ909_07060 [Thermosynechococcus sp. B0]WJI25504.1 hypothetical protein M0644_07135 [Thermosynechococcus sp. B1]WJI28036.1 hypothetical protein M0646_07140 [Thermosynechococcus sp. B3]
MLPEPLRGARVASTHLSQVSYALRQDALRRLIEELATAEPLLLEQNTLDLESSRDLAVSQIVLGWLRLTHERLHRIRQWLEHLYHAADPWQQSLPTRPERFQYAVPLGVVALVYEGLPTLSLMLAGMALKTGNALVLWSGESSRYTAGAIASLIEAALSKTSLPKATIQTLSLSPTSWLADPVAVDLALVYGRSRFVAEQRAAARCPLVSLSLGNTYLVWDGSVSPESVLNCIQHSHQANPDRALAIEKVIVLGNVNPSHLAFVINELTQAGYKQGVDEHLHRNYPEIPLVDASEWPLPYLDQRLAWHYEEDLTAAVHWIHQYGSAASGIIASSYEDCRAFYQQVQTPLVFVNRPPQLERLDALAIGAAARGCQRGLFGLGQLLSTKQVYL